MPLLIPVGVLIGALLAVAPPVAEVEDGAEISPPPVVSAPDVPITPPEQPSAAPSLLADYPLTINRRPGRAALQTSIGILGGFIWYWRALQFNPQDFDLGWDAATWKMKLTTLDAIRFDTNDFVTNAQDHSRAGVAYYLVGRANGFYALFEVKSLLSPSEIADAVAKCRRFKSLERHFSESASNQRTLSSLFVLWAYDSPRPETAKKNIIAAFEAVPPSERPDFVIVHDRMVVISGEYMELCKLGHPTSQHRQMLHKQHGQDLASLLPGCAEVNDFGEDSLLAWYVWFDSWLRRAGSRAADPLRYLPPIKNWGRRV